MSNKKNIDRLFQERFKDFDAAPPAAAWDKIEKELDGKKPVAAFPLWMKWISIAAGIALLATLAYTGYASVINDTNAIQQKVTDTNNHQDTQKDTNSDAPILDKVKTEQLPENDHIVTAPSKTTNAVHNTIPANSKKELISPQKNAVIISKTTLSTLAKNTNQVIQIAQKNNPTNNLQPTITTDFTKTTKNKNSATQQDLQNSLKINTTLEESQPAVHNSWNPYKNEPSNTAIATAAQKIKSDFKNNHTGTHKDSKNTNIAAIENTKDTIAQAKSLEEEVAAQQKTEEQKTDALPFKKWNASSVLAPIFSSTLGGSSIDEQFADNTKATGVNLSYGVNIGYHISPRLSVRTGVHSVNMSYTTTDIVYGREMQPGGNQVLSTDSFNRNAVSSPGNISTDNLGSSFSQEFLSDNTFTGFQGEISQRLGYLEVPLEVKYKLLDRKLSINVMGGMSALILTQNSIAVTNNTAKLELGEDDNFNSFNQSANLGIGIDYLFTDQLGITVEPMFKYQLNALRENVANFRPYNIGVYSGITYTF